MTSDKAVRRIDIGLVFLFSIATKIVLATLGLITPDGCLYLDAGRHFFQGKGFVTCYNFYQYWGPGACYPAWPLIPPLFPLLAGFVYSLFASIAAVNCADVVLSGVNGILIYLIVCRVFENRGIALASALLAGLTPSMRLTAPLPLSEQLDLFFLLVTVAYYVAGTRRGPWFWAALGLLTALGVLTRVAHVLCVPLFLAVFAVEGGGLKSWFFKAAWFLAGLAALLAPYEAFCYFRFGVIFPEYSIAMKMYNAPIFGGAYGTTKPILRTAFQGGLLAHVRLFLFTTPGKIAAYLGCLQDFLGAVAWLVPLRIIRCRIWRRPGEMILLLPGLGTMLFYAGSLYWDKVAEFDRYALIFMVLLIPLAIAELHDLFMRFPGTMGGRARKLYFSAAIAALMIVPLQRVSVRYGEFVRNRAVRGQEDLARDQMFRWLRDHTAPDDIIATSEIGYAFGIDRPIVGLPTGVMFNEKNLRDFFGVYHPRYIWVAAGFPTAALRPFCRRIDTGPLSLELRYRVFELYEEKERRPLGAA